MTLKSLKDKGAIKSFEEYRENDTKNPAFPIMGYKIFYGLWKRNVGCENSTVVGGDTGISYCQESSPRFVVNIG